MWGEMGCGRVKGRRWEGVPDKGERERREKRERV